ncbi:hypothetical protein TNCV_725891 [Trichonephila clavipes]|nr:hypothetical protein TNCV_725891 [Trichonephila clavipes]
MKANLIASRYECSRCKKICVCKSERERLDGYEWRCRNQSKDNRHDVVRSQPIREQLLSSKPRQKLLKIYHPDEAQKPRLPDPIVQPIAVMPLSRT